ncbi:hypothetical protein Tco_1280789 [Tanacetum coccineum]
MTRIAPARGGVEIEQSKELMNQFPVNGLINSEKVSPLRSGERISTDRIEEFLIEIMLSEEFLINNVSRMDASHCKSVKVHLVHSILEYL